MCGIVGVVAARDAAPLLLEGLRRLEYRGYDSSGIATCGNDGNLHRLRAVGSVDALAGSLERAVLPGGSGIAHTRWATHGAPTECNAHPHVSGNQVALVHNGIVENADRLRDALRDQGYHFESQTDTEVIAHLIHSAARLATDTDAALRSALAQIEGQFAIAVIDARTPDRLYVSRRGCPLIIGQSPDGNFIASDAAALIPYTRHMIHLEDDDIAEIQRDQILVRDAAGRIAERLPRETSLRPEAVELGEFRHYMQKEIFEQPVALRNTLAGRVGPDGLLEQALDSRTRELLATARAIHLIGCGTSYHAALLARYLIERETRIPCVAEQASEYRYRSPVVPPDTLMIVISQSGETADTLAALRMTRGGGYCGSLAICNVPDSSLAREADAAFMTVAGPEIGVASTKAFTTQLAALTMLTVALKTLHATGAEEAPVMCRQLMLLPHLIEQVLALEPRIAELAAGLVDKPHALFVARGTQYPIALEAALKLKEISYIHAEAYPAGELKHGPLALVDASMPVIAIAPGDTLLDKLRSNIQEIAARGGQLIVLTNPGTGLDSLDGVQTLEIPRHSGSLTDPFLYTVPLQLLAYHVAVLRGTDVDKPRNLAKSVTVE